MSLIIQEQFLAAQLQGSGANGVLASGYSRGGAMDEIAYRWNNHLLRNRDNTAQIEVFQGGFKAEFTEDTTICIAGADLNTTLNGKKITNWCMHHTYAGDVIHMSHATNGMRAYLAVAGGFLVEHANTVSRLNVGGFNGGILKAGDELIYIPTTIETLRGVRWSYIPDYLEPLTLHLIPGYQADYFSVRALKTLTENTYEISNRNDRMGICLKGAAIEYDGPTLPSEGIAFGAVQIPKDGEPIILMRDAQSIGGYPKIGSIFSLDCSLLSQKPTGSAIRFDLMSQHDALTIRRKILDSILSY